MHLYLITRGMKQYIQQFITELQGKYLPYKYKGADSILQVSVRPIQLWEICYPREHNDLMMTTIFGKKDGAKGITHQKKHRKYIALLRKMLSIKPLPKDYNDTNFLPISKAHTEFIGVGIKDDYNMEDGTEAI